MPNGIPGPQRGEDNIVRRPWPVDQKVSLVLEGLRGRRPVSELCREAGISPARYYQWREEFIDAARMGLVHSEAERHALEERVKQLEAENVSLRQRVRIFQELCVAD
jgi:transposase-like protein